MLLHGHECQNVQGMARDIDHFSDDVRARAPDAGNELRHIRNHPDAVLGHLWIDGGEFPNVGDEGPAFVSEEGIGILREGLLGSSQDCAEAVAEFPGVGLHEASVFLVCGNVGQFRHGSSH